MNENCAGLESRWQGATMLRPYNASVTCEKLTDLRLKPFAMERDHEYTRDAQLRN
jgi:hypothetical protein